MPLENNANKSSHYRRIALSLIPWEDDRLVMVKTNGRLHWGFPGGGCKLDEEFDKAAVRETEEETGLIVSPKRILGDYYYPNGKKRHVHVRVFYSEIIRQGIPRIADHNEIVGIGVFNEKYIEFLAEQKELRDQVQTLHMARDYFKNSLPS